MRINMLTCCGLAMVLSAASTTVHAAGDASQGKTKAVACAGCHGTNGIGVSDEFPNLAGQKEAYLLKQLKAYKSGDRKDPTMAAMVASLGDEDMANLAAYFSSMGNTSAPAPVAKTPTSPVDETQSNNNTSKDTQTSLTATADYSSEFPDTTFITMKKSGTVMSFPQMTTWEGGENMLYNAVTPDQKQVLATSPSTDSVYAFDAQTGKQVAVISVGKAPKGVKVTPGGKYAYVSNQGSATISIIDLDKWVVVDTIKVKEGPHNVRFTNDGKLAYVTLQGGAGIGVIDTGLRKMTRVIPVPGITGPHNLDLSADEKTAFVRDFVNHVAVVDLVNDTVKKVITVGKGHGGIDVIPSGDYAVTAAIADTIISIIDTKTLEVKTIDVGNAPHGIRASKDSRWLYTTLTRDNEIAVINLQTMQLEKKIPVGKFPFWVAVPGNP